MYLFKHVVQREPEQRGSGHGVVGRPTHMKRYFLYGWGAWGWGWVTVERRVRVRDRALGDKDHMKKIGGGEEAIARGQPRNRL